LATYLPGIFNLTLGVSAVLAFVMITYAGIQYMTTDAVFKKAEARSTLNGALGGLLLVLASYAILYTINPKILEFNLNIRRIDSTRFPSVSGASSSGTGGAYSYTNSSGATVYYNNCTSPCVSVGSGGLNLSATSGANSGTGTSPQVNSGLGGILVTANSSLGDDNLNIVITEAWPPTVNHLQPCHKVGTCVDARPRTEDITAENLKTTFEALQAAGAYVELETNDAELIGQLQELGYTGVILELPYPTHFSVYKDRQTKTP
jgi:hypothetical protein